MVKLYKLQKHIYKKKIQIYISSFQFSAPEVHFRSLVDIENEVSSMR